MTIEPTTTGTIIYVRLPSAVIEAIRCIINVLIKNVRVMKQTCRLAIAVGLIYVRIQKNLNIGVIRFYFMKGFVTVPDQKLLEN